MRRRLPLIWLETTCGILVSLMMLTLFLQIQSGFSRDIVTSLIVDVGLLALYLYLHRRLIRDWRFASYRDSVRPEERRWQEFERGFRAHVAAGFGTDVAREE